MDFPGPVPSVTKTCPPRVGLQTSQVLPKVSRLFCYWAKRVYSLSTRIAGPPRAFPLERLQATLGSTMQIPS